MEKIYQNIRNKTDLRANLIQLKQLLKTEKGKEEFDKLSGKNYDFLMRLLVEEDPKVRKNAAEILGALHCEEALDVLYDAYEAEDTLFIRADYVNAMNMLDCRSYLEAFKKRLKELENCEAAPEEKKHIESEKKALRQLILDKEGLKKHTFCGYERENEVILTTLKAFRDLTADKVRELTGRPGVRTGAGVKIKTADLSSILQIRTYKELLFAIHEKDDPAKGLLLPAHGEKMAEMLKRSDFMELIENNHGQKGPFYFRIGIQTKLQPEEKSRLAKEAAAALEKAYGGKLINSASHYELELRLVQNKEGKYYPCLKFFTIPDHRFAYRRYHIAAGMQPYVAAGIIALAGPYLKENAQVLDPFCGVGTLLVERSYFSHTKSSYGTELFGEAVEKARANARIAGMPIHFINRDFMDFKHDYLFDEIITDMPDQGQQSDGETKKAYRGFLERFADVLKEGGVAVVYTRKPEALKEQLKRGLGFCLEKEYCISEKKNGYLCILRYGQEGDV